MPPDIREGMSQQTPACFAPPEAGEPRPDPFLNAYALKLCHRAEDVHLKLAGGCCRDDSFCERRKGDAECMEVLKDRDHVTEVPTRPIQAPVDEDVKTSLGRVGHGLIEGESTVACTADVLIHVIQASANHAP